MNANTIPQHTQLQEQLQDDLAELDSIEKRLFAFLYASTSIYFNGTTVDPVKAAAGRGEALTVFDEEQRKLLCSPDTGELLERLRQAGKRGELDETRSAQVRILSRDRAQQADIPFDVASDFTRLRAEAGDVWHKAKISGDWASFEPLLDKIVKSMKHIASYKDASKSPYDVWLNEFEPGCDRALYDNFFEAVKKTVVPLVKSIAAHKYQPSRACVEGAFDPGLQWELGRELIKLEGVDTDALVLAKSEHPFTDSLTTQHVFVTSHVYEHDVLSNIFSILHEGGHALYEQGVDSRYNYTCLKGGTSMGMHETQSRFFENIVGHSKAFAPVLLDLLTKYFPERMSGVKLDAFYAAENRVTPSLIRMDADELTYPLHILIRYEMEQELFAGDITARDVPRVWAQKYKDYLGIDVPNHSVGALQDMHWSDGCIGYFPTYALGSAYGNQLTAKMIEEGMDFDGVIASGDLEPIREWLRSRIWRYGRSKDPLVLFEQAVGAKFDPRFYTEYLEKKFSDIYQL